MADDEDKKNEGLMETVAAIRVRMNDPCDLEYGGRPDRVAARELELKALLIRAGVTEAPITPMEVARATHEAQFPPVQVPEGLQDLIDNRLGQLEAAGERAIGWAQDELRQQLGGKAYEALLKEAQGALDKPLTAAAKGDHAILKMLAGMTKYEVAREKDRPQ